MPRSPLTSPQTPVFSGRLSPRRGDRTHVRAVVPPVLADRISKRRNPRPASQMLWHERVVTATGRYIQLTIPLVGRHDAELGVHLAAHLDRLWTNQPTPGGERVTSVSALVGHKAGRSFLIVFLSLDHVPVGRRIDDARMARHLRSALQQVGSGGQA